MLSGRYIRSRYDLRGVTILNNKKDLLRGTFVFEISMTPHTGSADSVRLMCNLFGEKTEKNAVQASLIKERMDIKNRIKD